ncbi:LPS export ABC transporter periplasmic protein LptC [Catenovulum maritimum]|uniref:Lipopolysaccharide export system protein LptC n=1 Tax=Catenovulum maritimum TaxID=1513271 RepID=A0A0J8GQN3_9ALTE|nr:LPS export ABC transporter periplasmic protein LptC [Catenovulum maritimum]KMT65022.1 hypothetical protein XM47_11105 [Catenovulum maritimum]
MSRLIFSIFVICFISYKLWQNWDSEKISKTESQSAYAPDYQIEGLSQTIFTTDGQIKTKLTAENFEHYEELEFTFIKQPSYTLFGSNKDSNWMISAKESSVHDNLYLELVGDVKVESVTKNNWLNQIEMDQINMNLNTRVLSTDTQITGSGKAIEFTGKGLKANLNTQEFEFTDNVQTKYLVN